MTITHDALDLIVQPPPNMGHGDPWPCNPAGDIWWPSLETCSNLFIGLHCTGPPLVLTSDGH